ncbi:MAG: ATP-binding cassette domain-containing protein, partial [Peptostreptococcales bacterium]
MLKVENLHVHYGAIHALKGISFEVKKGEIVTLIGSNGAGKTTTLHTIAGLLKPTSGSIILKEQDLTKIEAHKLVSLGMAQVPEGRRIFSRMTVYENLEIGAFHRNDKEAVKKELHEVLARFP